MKLPKVGRANLILLEISRGCSVIFEGKLNNEQLKIRAKHNLNFG